MPNAARNPKNHFAAFLSAAFLYPFSALYIPPSFFASRFPAAARFSANKNRYSGRMVTISEIDFIWSGSFKNPSLRRSFIDYGLPLPTAHNRSEKLFILQFDVIPIIIS